MWNWLKDALGINRYVLAWDFITKNGTHLKGRDIHVGNRWFAQRMASGMNRDYGAGTHWVERAHEPNRPIRAHRFCALVDL